MDKLHQYVILLQLMCCIFFSTHTAYGAYFNFLLLSWQWTLTLKQFIFFLWVSRQDSTYIICYTCTSHWAVQHNFKNLLSLVNVSITVSVSATLTMSLSLQWFKVSDMTSVFVVSVSLTVIVPLSEFMRLIFWMWLNWNLNWTNSRVNLNTRAHDTAMLCH